MTSQDILAFLKADKAERQKEREEDMSKIADMIKEGVKAEVQAALKPLDERLAGQELVTEGLGTQLGKMLEDMEVLRGEVQTLKDFPVLPQPRAAPSGIAVGRVEVGSEAGFETVSGVEDSFGVSEAILDICRKARRIIGFTPIEPRMIEIQKSAYGAKDTEEAMLMEIKSYLKCEMKVKPSDIDKLDIVKIFPPAREEWNTLYVEFGSESEVDNLFKYTRVMCKADHRLVRWIPKEMYDRFRALESISYTMRENMKAKGIKLKTRVKIGRNDLEFSVKLPNSGWRSEPLPGGLPGIDLEAGRKPSLTSSPPPGRPDRSDIPTRKKRPLSGNSSDSEDDAKKLKSHPISKQIEGDKLTIMESNMEDQQDTVTGNLDIGQFTNTEGYSPATPAKAKSIPDLSVVINSPVFHNKSKCSK